MIAEGNKGVGSTGNLGGEPGQIVERLFGRCVEDVEVENPLKRIGDRFRSGIVTHVQTVGERDSC